MPSPPPRCGRSTVLDTRDPSRYNGAAGEVLRTFLEIERAWREHNTRDARRLRRVIAVGKVIRIADSALTPFRCKIPRSLARALVRRAAADGVSPWCLLVAALSESLAKARSRPRGRRGRKGPGVGPRGGGGGGGGPMAA